MPWTSKYPNAEFAERLITNLTTVTATNEAAALTWANGGTAMSAFQPYRRTRWVNTLWPTLSFILQTSEVPESGDESRLDEEHRVVVEIEEVGKDADSIAASIQKRVRAVAMIVLAATQAELMNGYTKAGQLTKDISPIDYRDFFNENSSLYKKVASFTVTFTFMETK